LLLLPLSLWSKTKQNVSTLPDIAVSNETEFELIVWVDGGSGVVVSAGHYY